MITIHELYADIHRWQKRTFPNQRVESKIKHLQHEVDELARKPKDIAEMADCLILLFGIAGQEKLTADQLISAAAAKMEINKRRQWEPADADGVHHHINPAEAA